VGPRAGLDRWKIRPHWDSIPDRPARSQSLYRLSYPGPQSFSNKKKLIVGNISVISKLIRYRLLKP